MPPVEDVGERSPVHDFVDEVAAFMALRGLPRMAGRLYAWLLVAEPPEQTAAELGRALHASPGSISTMTRLLVSLGLIQRTRRRGERADRFWIPPAAMRGMMTSQLEAVRTARQLFDRGLEAMAHRPPAARRRVRELRDMWRFWEQELPDLMDRWEESRKDRATA